MVVCYEFLKQHEQAKLLLHKVLQHDPNNQQARDLLAGYTGIRFYS
ncbi:hypothetical protein [Nostoc commune]|nr:hypothetical protein [Nostoc commune]